MSEIGHTQIWESVQRLIALIAPRLNAIEARQEALERAIEGQGAKLRAALDAVGRGE